MVAVFHFTYQWSGQYFYEDYVSNDFFKSFTLGVQLFFMISGYVIFKTIENTSHLREFFFKRAKRLWPTLCLALPLLYLIQKFVKVENYPSLNWKDLVISLFIINPSYASFLFELEFHFVTGVMWSLTYELTFYFLIGVIYFGISKKYVFEIFYFLTNFFLICNYFYLFSTNSLGKGFLNPINTQPSLQFLVQQSGLLHLSWFAIGMWFYKHEGTKVNLKKLIPLIHLMILAAYDAAGGTSAVKHVFLSLITALFTSLFLIFFLLNSRQKILFTGKIGDFLIKIGNSSYEFYLIHEIIGVMILTLASSQNFFSNKEYLSIIVVPSIIYLLLILANWLNYISVKVNRWK